MRVVKFSSKQHNFTRSRSLRLHTLNWYRETENAEIKDAGEGTFRIRLQFLERVRLSRASASALLQGASFFGSDPRYLVPGNVTALLDTLQFKVERDHVVFERAGCDLFYQPPNGFVFCAAMSEAENAMQENGFEGYDDFWIVGRNEGELTVFCDGVARRLEAQFHPDLAHPIQNVVPRDRMRNIRVEWRRAKIAYGERVWRVTGQVPDDPSYFCQAYLKVPFIKPERYRHENEYSFAFTYVSEGMVIPVETPFIDLDFK